MKSTQLIIFAIFNVSITNSARILGVALCPSFSHQIMYRPLWKELSLRGHELVVLTTDPMNDPSLTNLTEIDLHFSYEIWNEYIVPFMVSNGNPLTTMDLFFTTFTHIFDQQMSCPEVQTLLHNKNQHFDLLITEALAPHGAAFSERFKCPYIGVIPMDAHAAIYNEIGNPVHPITNPDNNLPFFGKLNFFERLESVSYNLIIKYLKDVRMKSTVAVFRKHFGKDIPDIMQILNRMDLLFVNTNPVLNQIRPLMPNVIQIGGGIHRHKSKPLPKELQEHLDNAPQGCIYFSLGSNVKSKDLPENMKTILLETFSELPYKVLWKFELEDLPGRSNNVIISKWFPQQDVFKHPNIKLFITQGGVQSIDEALFDHIPMLGLPFFLDQLSNVQQMVDRGLGLSLDYKTLDKAIFKATILEVINNPKYRNNVKRLADLANDQPMAGLEKAVWWTEYVIRHKGAQHLRSPLLDIPTYQYYLLDVLGFCLIVILITIYLILVLFSLLGKLLAKYTIYKSKRKTD